MSLAASVTSEVLRLTTSMAESTTTSLSSVSITNRDLNARMASGMLISDIKAMEHPTLKVPYEILNKKFRSAQKNIDREVAHVQVSVSELEKAVKGNESPAPTIALISDLLTNVVDKLTVLKRKSEESITDELDAAAVCKKRLDHLKEYSTKGTNEAALTQWKKKRLDRMLVDHFLRSGYYDSACKLALHSQIQDLTNIGLFMVSKEVEESLANHKIDRCLSWCYDNKSKLRKIKSTLEFNLRQQEFIEMVRSDRRMDAVKHARKYFSTFEEGQKIDFQHVMGLLAFPSNSQMEPYKSLFDESRWNSLIDQFRSDNFKLYQLSSTSVFSVVLQAGLSSLKTPHCYKKDGERNPDCPVCSELLNKLASSLPCAHCSQSRLVCYISGQPLNEHNQPLVLPNGYVYGEDALKRMAKENDNKIVCPRTREIFDFKDLEKVFVM